MTDVESSTALWERSPDAMSVALERHDRIIADAVSAHGGELVRDRGEGDSTFAVFDSACDAVSAAAEFGRALMGAEWPDEAPLRVRVAVYTGPATERDGDFYGTTVNRAARVRSLAFGGQVLLGSRTAAAARGALPPMTSLVDLGPRALRDLTDPEHLFELRLEDADVPPEPLSDAASSNVRWAHRTTWSGFVDRDHERGALARAWSAATRGECVLALVEGEAGIGKTALAAELAKVAVSGGGLVLYGRFDEDVLAPFQAFRESLDSYARVCPRSILRADLREHGPEIARLFPEIGVRIDTTTADGTDVGEAERLRQFEAVESWFEAIASRRPVLLVLDDLHWADRPSILLLQHLVRSPRRIAMLVCATFRGGDVDRGELGALLPGLSRDADVRSVSLSGLGKDAVADLVGRVSGRGVDVHAVHLADELFSDTAGNPLFLREIVQPLSETGTFDVAALKRLDLPDTVRELVRWRVRQLPDEARDALAVASVIGQEFELDVLAKVCEVSDDALSRTLDDARRAGVLHETTGSGYAFSHAIVRRSLLEDLTGARRFGLHWRIGEALEERRPPATPAELAHHFCAAVNASRAAKAIRYARAAGDRAMSDLAFETAVAHYAQALVIQAAQCPEDAVLHCELLLALAESCDKAGDYAQRDASYLDAATDARKIKRTDLFAKAALGYGGALPAATEPDPQRQSLLEEALATIGDGESRERALILGRLAHSLALVPPRERREALVDEAVAIARRLGDPADLANVLVSRVWALDGPYDLEDQLAAASEVRTLGERASSRELVLRALHCRNDALFEGGRIDELRASVNEMRTLAEAARYPEYTRITRAWEAVFRIIEGRYEDGERIVSSVREQLRTMGYPQSELVYAAVTFPMHWLRGTLAEGLRLYEALAAQFPDRLVFPVVAAWIAAEAGMPDKARAALDDLSKDAVRDSDQSYLWWSMMVGCTCASSLLRDAEWAALLHRLISPYPDRFASAGSSSFYGASSLYIGMLEATLGRPDEAVASFEDALARHDAMGARPFSALTQASLAGVLIERDSPGDRDRAAALRTSAAATADDLGLGAVHRRLMLRASS